MMMRKTDRTGTADAASLHAGDQVFEALYRECAADVHGYALSLLGDQASAEDVTALAFERLLRARRRLDPGRGTPRALLFTIARNAALDELRGAGVALTPTRLRSRASAPGRARPRTWSAATACAARWRRWRRESARSCS